MQARKDGGRSRKAATVSTGKSARSAARTSPKKSSRLEAVRAVKPPTKSSGKAAAKPKQGASGNGKAKAAPGKTMTTGSSAKPRASSTRSGIKPSTAEREATKPVRPTTRGVAAASEELSVAPTPPLASRPPEQARAEPSKSEPSKSEPSKSEPSKSNAAFARPSPWSAPVLPPVKVETKPAAKADGAGDFRVGETVVYPARGVADIVAIEEKEIGGKQQSFYVLRVHDTEQKILVPVSNAAQIGLRRPISEAQVREIFRILKVTDVPIDTQTWNRRYRGFVEKLATGSVFAVAEVLRDLSRVRIVKDGLSFSERQMLERARGLIVKEIAVARAKPEDAVREQIEAIFA